MTAYVVFTHESTRDQTELDMYRSKVRGMFDGHAHKVLAAYGAQQVPEGNAPEGIVILQFASLAEARAWYDSDAYQEAARHRIKGGQHRAMFVEGL
jgi:uncharacterized protein (DUF1330 family)